MQGFSALMMPTAGLFNAQKKGPSIVAASGAKEDKYNLSYYLKGALAGGICCSITHGAMWYVGT